MTNILVLGAGGTVGTPLVTELRRRGYNVTATDKRATATTHRVDISSYRQLQTTLQQQQPTLVYNLAAEFGRWNGEAFYEQLWATNVVGFKHLLTLQAEYGFKLVHFSSSEVYGDFAGAMTEDVMDNVEVRQLNDYAISKWVNELQALNTTQPIVRVRLFNTYGPAEYYTRWRSAICRFCYYALHNQPFTVYRLHTRTHTYVDDTCRTLANLVERFIPGRVYNIAGVRSYSMETVAQSILTKTQRPYSLVNWQETEPHTTMHKRVSVAHAIAELDHKETVDLDEGLDRTLRWMRQVYRV